MCALRNPLSKPVPTYWRWRSNRTDLLENGARGRECGSRVASFARCVCIGQANVNRHHQHQQIRSLCILRISYAILYNKSVLTSSESWLTADFQTVDNGEWKKRWLNVWQCPRIQMELFLHKHVVFHLCCLFMMCMALLDFQSCTNTSWRAQWRLIHMCIHNFINNFFLSTFY